MITLSVALPVYNSRDIAWLAMESLCRQTEINFDWELIICEEQNNGMCGVDFFNSYKDRLLQIRCQYIKYIPLASWIPLAQKWKMIGSHTCRTSVVFVMQAADDYWHNRRLKMSYDALINKTADWYMSTKVYMYHIQLGNVIIYDQELKGISGRRLPAVGHACLTKHARGLLLSSKNKGVDGWFYQSIRNIKVRKDVSSAWKRSCGTHGCNHISKSRTSFFTNITPPFKKTSKQITDILPPDIVKRLVALRKNKPLPVVQPDPEPEPVLEPAPCILEVQQINTPLSFVWVWVKSAAVWSEIAYSIKSVRKFYQGEYNLFVVGDDPAIKGVTHIPAKIINGFAYCRSMDIANKLQIIINTPEISENFGFMYDDIMFLKPVTRSQLSLKVAHDHVDDYSKYFRPGSGVMPSGRWRTLFTQTMFQLEKKKLPTYNYETHLPRILNKIMLKKVMERFELNAKPYLFNSLYFNSYYKDPDVLLRKNFNIKAGVYRPFDNIKALERELNNKLYLNFDDRGLNALLKKEIQKRLI